MNQISWIWTLIIGLFAAIPFSIVANLLTPKTQSLLRRAGASWLEIRIAYWKEKANVIERRKSDPVPALASLVALATVALLFGVWDAVEHIVVGQTLSQIGLFIDLEKIGVLPPGSHKSLLSEASTGVQFVGFLSGAEGGLIGLFLGRAIELSLSNWRLRYFYNRIRVGEGKLVTSAQE